MISVGPVGRLGRYAATRRRRVAVVWAIVALALGALAPLAEHALSGAGWEASGSESVRAREALDRDFRGAGSYGLQVAVSSERLTYRDPEFRRVVARAERALAGDEAVAGVTSPEPGTSVARDGRTAIIRAGAAKQPDDMVRAAARLKDDLGALGTGAVDVDLTGAAAMWSDFNDANKEAMLKSELLSWPVTLAIMVVAFGSLVAAGLPLMLTITGLIASGGLLFLGAQLLDISIWAMNFALMFALALGIDYALFILMRFRAAHFASGLQPVDAVAVAMDTAGKAVLFSGLTVLVALSAVMLVPSPAFRSMALGIMASVVFVLAASLTLLPAVLGKLGPRVNRLSLPWVHAGEHRSRFSERWAERVWARPLAYGLAAVVALGVLAFPILRLDTGMPSIKVVPKGDPSRQGYERVQAAFGQGAPGALQVVAPAGTAGAARAELGRDPGVATVLAPLRGNEGATLLTATPKAPPSSERLGEMVDRLRASLPAGVLVGGAAAENHDLEAQLGAKTPLVIGVVVALGFLLLLIAFRAPLAAALGVLTNLLATGAAFGVGAWIFQDGHLSGLLGFESQGFMDAWAPVFFFAMIFAIGMDYTVFLLSSAREHWEREADARAALVGGMAHSGRVILSAGAVMVAVFFTFALSGPLPPKEMGVILGVAVLLDIVLVRLFVVPVTMRLAGRAAWYLPSWLGRALPKVSFGHGGAAATRPAREVPVAR